MDLDVLLRQLSDRMSLRPRDRGDDPTGRDHDDVPGDPGYDAPPRRLRMRLRGALLDPGRRGARALGLAALLAVAATAIWVIVDEPAGGMAPMSAQRSEAGDVALSSSGAAPAGTLVAGTTSPAGSADPAAAPPSGSATVLLVHVAGLVAAPGVYELADGARVADAIEAAGGPLPGADLSSVNLARRVADGEQIAIGVPGAADPPSAPGASAGAAPASAAVDINTADAATLDTLPGIGPVLAQRIVDWRAEHGRFGAIDDLRQVSGIGSATFERLAPLVRV